MMDEREILLKAHDAIKAGNYHQAQGMLELISHHPKAQEWLAKLEGRGIGTVQTQPPQPKAIAEPTQRRRRPRSAYDAPEKMLGAYKESRLTLTFWLLTAFSLGYYAIIKHPRNRLILTSRRIIHERKGLLGGTETSILLRNVTDVTLQRSPLGAIFGYGNIAIQTAGSGGVEIIFFRLARAQDLKTKILSLQQRQ